MDDKKTLMFHGGQQNPSTPAAGVSPAQAPQQPPGHGGQQSPWNPPSAMQPPQQPHSQQPPLGAPQYGQPQSHGHNPQPLQPPQQQNPYGHQQQPGAGYLPQQHQPGPQPAWGGFPGGGANMAQHVTKKKIILGIVGAIAIAVLGVAGAIVKNKYGGGKSSQNTVSYSRLGINKNKANVDDLIVSLEKQARRWRKDAVWWGLTMYGVRPDGTVDLTDNGGAAIVKFVSPSGVQSHAKSTRRDSIKEYSMTRDGARSNKMIGAKKAWKDFQPVSIPNCKVTDLVKALNQRGFDGGTVRVGFDVKFAFASGWAWTVDSENKKLAGFYSMGDCSFIKAR